MSVNKRGPEAPIGVSQRHGHLSKYGLLFVGIWTTLIVASLAWTTWTTRANLEKLALVQARTLSAKDVLYRRWGSTYGGIYVNLATGIDPNPLLRDFPDRDIRTESGVTLTLVNPEYMSEMVYAMEDQSLGIKTGMTSANPLNPKNQPDPWENNALRQLREGQADVSIIEDRAEGRVLRLMTPLKAEQGCLQCHDKHGYVLGDVCGGLTVLVPMKPYEEQAGSEFFNQGFTHVLIWLFGLLAIGSGFRKYAISERSRRRTEDDLIAATLAAESANQAKGEFLANMSHEVRTPMNAIIGMTELALDSDLTSHQKDCLETVKFSAESLLGLLNDILDFSKIESGMLEFESVSFRLGETIETVMRTLAVPAHKKGLELLFHIGDRVPDALVGDPLRLRQILLNLLGNAVKFTERGEVMLRIEWVDATEDSCRLSFSVRDTGVGIPDELQGRLFKNFSQADVSTSRKFGGSGLGLAISKALTEGMGGEISMRSMVGEGSVFTAVLPFPMERTALPEEPSPLAGKKLLIVDDHELSRELLTESLHRCGATTVAIDSGDCAIQKLHEARYRQVPFDAVVMDGGMPGMDGVTTASIIREHLDTRIPIVLLLTTINSGVEISRCAELDIQSYLLKPVSARQICQMLQGCFQPEAQPAASGGGGGLNPPTETDPDRDRAHRYHLLLAEDNSFNQKLALALARKKNWDMTLVVDGKAAVEAVAQDDFDLILMDVQMPEVDGLAATRAIRRLGQERGRNVPVIGMTAHAMPGDRERCLAAGMDDYVAKPIKPELFYAVVERYLKGDGSARPVCSQARQANSVFERNLKGNQTLVADLARDFLQDYPETLIRIKSSIAQGRCRDLEFLAHNLKSVVGFFNAESAYRLARQMEIAAHEERLELAGEILEQLEHALAEIRDELSTLCRQAG